MRERIELRIKTPSPESKLPPPLLGNEVRCHVPSSGLRYSPRASLGSTPPRRSTSHPPRNRSTSHRLRRPRRSPPISETLGLSAARAPRAAGRRRIRLGPQSDRPVHPRRARDGRAAARARGRSRRADPPGHVRPDRPAARRPRRSPRSWPTPGPTPTSGWSTGLLASPQYGERWAQHWLDLAHYADSNGFELDAERPDAWRYRDWVVDALNADMPYDRFLALQLAGDELEPGDPDALIATGFGRCGPREVVGGNVIPEVKRQNELTEITGTVGSVFLGLTIGCARCHDHKFDAIPTTDYYRLQSFFAASPSWSTSSIASQGRDRGVRGRREGDRQPRSPRSASSSPSSRPPTARRSPTRSRRCSPPTNGRCWRSPRRSARPSRRSSSRGFRTRSGSPGKRSPRPSPQPRSTTRAREASSGRSTRSSRPASPAGARHGPGRREADGPRHVRPPPRRLPKQGPEGRAPAAGGDPRLAAERRVFPSDAIKADDKNDRPPRGAGRLAGRRRTTRWSPG